MKKLSSLIQTSEIPPQFFGIPSELRSALSDAATSLNILQRLKQACIGAYAKAEKDILIALMQLQTDIERQVHELASQSEVIPIVSRGLKRRFLNATEKHMNADDTTGMSNYCNILIGCSS